MIMSNTSDLTGLLSELRMKKNELLLKGHWNVSLFYQGEIIWSSQQIKRAWAYLSDVHPLKIRTIKKVLSDDGLLNFTVYASSIGKVDEVWLEIKKGKEILYVTKRTFPVIYLGASDNLTFSCDITLKEV